MPKPTTPPTTPPTMPKAPPTAAPTPTPNKKADAPAKTFSVGEWSDSGEGEKIIIYGRSGMGKTTLAAMAPNPVFIGVDDGGRKIRNPLTGKPVHAIHGIETFKDVRDALRQPTLFDKYETIVIDTVTKVESLSIDYIVDNYNTKSGKAKNFRSFGWDGERHQLDEMRNLLTDIDPLVRKGKNIVLLAQLAQISVANAGGDDYIEDGPKLQHRKDCSVRTELCEWADHVFRIGLLNFEVEKDAQSKQGKVTSDDDARAVFTGGAAHFFAKSRPVTENREVPYRVPNLISFAQPNDPSLWSYVFGGAVEGA